MLHVLQRRHQTIYDVNDNITGLPMELRVP